MKRNVIACGLVAAVATTILATPALAVERVSASEKGSLLIYSKVEIRWDVAGNLIQDTFVDLTNDYTQDVQVQMYFINGDPSLDAVFNGAVLLERAHPGWNNVDVGIHLTANQPTYWSAATGQPAGVSPFTILDPGTPPGRPDPAGSSDRVLRGYIVAWAVDSNGNEIRWNHLKGDAVIVNYLLGTAWEYTTWAFQAIAGVQGGLLLAPYGQMDLDGIEYELPFDILLLDFYAVGTSALSGPTNSVTLDTDLTLFPVDVDLRQETEGPVTTKASFTIWNMNEVKLTGLDRCVTCWDQTLLSTYGVPNHFLVANLQTAKGKAQIDGLESQLCDFDYDPSDVCTQAALGGGALTGANPSCDPRDVKSQAAALLGVVAKHLSFTSGDYAAAGMNLIGLGTQPGGAVIKADFLGNPPDERPQQVEVTKRKPVQVGQ
ncbi:MAG: hypothetical protein H6817_08645 [Phycisphaerales bacterium]|nr:hypothetical protein [Phycisphaerales bacterium]